MKLVVLLGLVLGFAVQAAEDKAPLKDQRDKVSYAYGMNIGGFLKRQSVDTNQMDVSLIAAGIRDALGGKTILTEAEAREVMMAFQTEMRNRQMEKAKVEGGTNKKAGDEFLAANAKKEGVKSFPDGLQYKVLASGKGKQPKASDTISAHYRGTLIDGTEFDSSYSRGQPLKLKANQVIPGWTEALTNMHVGDKWQLFIPSNLAYGERGMPPKIGPNAVLIFEMELLDVEEAPAAAPAGPAAPAQK